MFRTFKNSLENPTFPGPKHQGLVLRFEVNENIAIENPQFRTVHALAEYI